MSFTDSASWPELDRVPEYYDRATSDSPCARCGKKVNEARAYWVRLTGDDTLVPNDYPDDTPLPDGHSDMGGYPMGSDCAKKFPAEFVFKGF